MKPHIHKKNISVHKLFPYWAMLLALFVGSCEEREWRPEIVSTQIKLITSNSAEIEVEVEADKSTTVISRGVCWNTSGSPTIEGKKLNSGTGAGNFNVAVSNLNSETNYYLRAYATSNAGTAYGEEKRFETKPVQLLPIIETASIVDITQTSATGGGEVTSDGNDTETLRGVCWSTSQNPTVANSRTTDGHGKGSFISSITNLLPNTTYYVQAYAINSMGAAYGNEVSFKTGNGISLATITTNEATEITSNSVKLGGNVIGDGNASVTERGICYNTSTNPTTNNTKLAIGSGMGSFSNSVTGLTPNTTYYARAYAINSNGIAYGNEVSFKTGNGISLATLTTNEATEITGNSVTLGGNVISDGNAFVTERGVCYSTSTYPTTSNTKLSIGSGMGSFSNSVTGLTPNTTYYVRAYAINSKGIAYGNEVSFKSDIDNTGNITYGSFIDSRDGHTYKTVEIGDQRWMAENLAYLPSVSPTNVNFPSSTYYYVPDYNGTNVNSAKSTNYYKTYGVLYNYLASKNACPSGWKLPSDIEWEQLSFFISEDNGGYNKISGSEWQNVGVHLKAKDGWLFNGNGSDDYGFSALPGGYIDPSGNVSSIGELGQWWCSQNGGNVYTYKSLNTYFSSFSGSDTYPQCGLSVRCFQDINFTPTKPIIETDTASNITFNSAQFNGNIISDGGNYIKERGFCWSHDNQYPTLNDNNIKISGTTGKFNSVISDLEAFANYHVRAYAINEVGIEYGEKITFKTKPFEIGAFIDPRDGESYNWLKIGEQVWMAENLAYLPKVSGPGSGSEVSSYYYVYGYNGTNISSAKSNSNYNNFGVLYNWTAAKNACPTGWHLPSDIEWNSLVDYMINNGFNFDNTLIDNKIAKSLAAKTTWNNSTAFGAVGNEPLKNNISGFSMLPSGFCNVPGDFYNINQSGYWWSSTQFTATNAMYWHIEYNKIELMNSPHYKSQGYSVRCLKN